MKKIISFVHGYHDLKKNLVDIKRPALLEVIKKKVITHNFFFLVTLKIFLNIKNLFQVVCQIKILTILINYQDMDLQASRNF